MPRSVAEIEADIARVKQEIVARNTYKQPQTRVGWGSYIVEGDRGLLDAYQNRENQYNQMMQQQAYQSAERALQQKFQEEEARKNRELQLEIAKMNKESAREDKMDEYELNYRKAIAARNSAETALKFDKSDDPTIKQTLQRNLDDANAGVAYWGKKRSKDSDTVEDLLARLKALGWKEPTAEPEPEPNPEDVITQEDQGQITDAEISTKEWTNAARDKAREAANKLKDPGDRAKALKEIENKGPTKEEAAAAKVKRQKDFEKLWNDLPKGPKGDPKPGALAKAKKDPKFMKLYKEFKGGD